MPAQSTFPPPAPPTGTTADTDTNRLAERRHAVWVEIAEGMLQRCPDPASFRVHTDLTLAVLTVLHAAHVAAWAAFLGLPAPRVMVQDVREPEFGGEPYRLTTTTTSGVLDGVRWFVDHNHLEPIPDAVTGPADGANRTGGDGE